MTIPVLPPGSPPWLIVAVVVVVVLLTVSERVAKLSGPLGALARWWQTRQERAAERETTTEMRNSAEFQRQLTELRESIRRSDEAHSQEIADLRQDMADSQSRAEERDQRQQTLIDDLTDYAAYSIGWGRDIRLAAAEHGWHPAFAPLLSFTEWRKNRPNPRRPPD